jgi:hypothetical protein
LERFSPDKDWMPSLVLIAKNAYVWLDQLSKAYRRSITRLDQVPDEELDRLARSGFSAAVADRPVGAQPGFKAHQAAARQSDAVASAYSLFDYQIAGDLGGDEAYQPCATAPGSAASAWQAIWSPTIWASTRPG